MTTLAASYHECQRVARRAASNFYWSFWLLPREKRRAMAALYAFSRHTDDLGDGERPLEERDRSLAEWRRALESALSGSSDHALLPAVADAVRRFDIPAQHLFEIIDGVAMDLRHAGFATFDDLRHYCYHVASAVGLACVHIWGFTNDAIRAPAIECGIAFQLTNILRDLKEDAESGRVYLPREDFERFGCTAADLTRGNLTDGERSEPLARLIEFEISRAEQLYAAATPTRDFLHADGRRSFDLMFRTYQALLLKIKRRPADIFHRRVRLSLPKKFALAAGCFG